MHLFVSFMLRAVSIFVKDLVVDANGGMQQYDAVLMDDISVVSISPLDKTQYVSFDRRKLRTNTVYVIAENESTYGINND